MIIFGGLVGFVVGGLLIGIPLALALAVIVGSAWVPPLLPLFTVVGLPGIIVLEIIHILVVVLLYVLARIDTTPNSTGTVAATGPLEAFCRGAMIGLNTAVNALVLMALPLPFAGLLGIVALVLNGMAVFPIARDPIYQGILNWCSWFFPMSWIANLLGFIFMLAQVITGWIGGGLRWFVEWPAGAIVTHGGAVFLRTTAWHLGNFIFFPWEWNDSDPFRDPTPPPPLISGFALPLTINGVIFHENAHVASAASFGTWFLLIGAVEENLIPPPTGGFNAYAEQVAEGLTRHSQRSWITQWTASTTANVPATLTVTGTATGAVTRGTAITMTATVADPDGGPQARFDPGVSPATGLIWLGAMFPADGRVEIEDPNASTVVMTPRDGGILTFCCQATDGFEGDFLPDISMDIVGADAGGPYTTPSNTDLSLSGGGSHAGTLGVPPSDVATTPLTPVPPPLAFSWAVTAVPPTSGTATLTGATTETPVFRANAAGEYLVSLTITTTTGVTDLAVTMVTVTGS